MPLQERLKLGNAGLIHVRPFTVSVARLLLHSCLRWSSCQVDTSTKSIALPWLLGSSRRCQHRFLDVLEKIEMVETGMHKLSRQRRGIRPALITLVGCGAPRCAGIRDEHALLLCDGHQPFGRILGRKLQLVAA